VPLPVAIIFTRADALAAPVHGAPLAPLACIVRTVELVAPFCRNTCVPSVAIIQSPLLPPLRVQSVGVVLPAV